jgi:hypothetical protein
LPILSDNARHVRTSVGSHWLADRLVIVATLPVAGDAAASVRPELDE